MENENDSIKNTSYLDTNKRKIYHRLKNVFSLQIINIILFVLLIFIFSTKEKNKLFNDTELIKKHKNYISVPEKIKLLKLITNNDVNEYKGIEECLLNDPDEKLCIYHLITPKEVLGRKRVLLGDKHDGCYVLLNDFKDVKIAYSFGIHTNIQFDKALADRNIDIFMYDHTIKSLPYQNPRFHWKPIGLCGMKTKNNKLKNLEQLILENGHLNEENMILKIDIEEWEWESIIDLKEETLNKFKYIAIEYHFKDENIHNYNQLYYNVIKKISKTHQSFYARCNGDRSLKVNFGYNRICRIMEVSYIIRKNNMFKNDETIYPIYEFEYLIPQKGKLEMNLNILKLFD